jgi:hypothetical protein
MSVQWSFDQNDQVLIDPANMPRKHDHKLMSIMVSPWETWCHISTHCMVWLEFHTYPMLGQLQSALVVDTLVDISQSLCLEGKAGHQATFFAEMHSHQMPTC